MLTTATGLLAGTGAAAIGSTVSAPQAVAATAVTPDWLNVVSYGADPTGAVDSTAAIQNAVNALPAGGGVVYLPAGTYVISTALIPSSGVRITGDGYMASKITSTASAIFNMAPASLLDNVEIDHLTLSATGFDVFSGAHMVRVRIHDCNFIQNSAGNAIWNAPSVMLMIECAFEKNREDVYGATRTVAAWYLNGTSSTVVTHCKWADNVCFNQGADSTQWWYQIVSSGASTLNEACSFRDIVFENPLGGMIDLQSHTHGIIENCLAWDTTANITQSLVNLRKSATSSVPCRGTTIISSGRASTASTFGAGAYDIAMDANTEQTLILTPPRSAQLNLGGSTSAKVISRSGTPTITGGSATATAGAGAGTSPPAPLVTNGPTNECGRITWGTGTSPGSGNQVHVTFGTPFSTTPQVIVCASTGPTGPLQLYVSTVSTTGFTLSTANGPTTADKPNTTYGFCWYAIA